MEEDDRHVSAEIVCWCPQESHSTHPVFSVMFFFTSLCIYNVLRPCMNTYMYLYFIVLTCSEWVPVICAPLEDEGKREKISNDLLSVGRPNNKVYKCI